MINEQTLHTGRIRLFFGQTGMGVFTFIFSLMLLMAHAQGRANTDSAYISIRLVEAPLQKAFGIIRQQTPYRFIYDNSLLKKAKPVTVSVERASLVQVLNQLFREQPFNYRIIGENIILTPLPSKPAETSPGTGKPVSPARDTVITGTVVADSALLPLAGATVSIKGAQVSTVTDNAGRFRIAIPDSKTTLIISYVGYITQSVVVNNNTNNAYTIILQKAPQEMEEVTVYSTGYEALPKERATGSFYKIDNATLNQQVGTNILNRLNGVTSGLLFNIGKKNNNPQNNTNISIRGLSTINGPLDPLIVLDGFIYEGDINNINPNDIENITILKDAAASSIWGARAGNGVIVITTKKGRYNRKLQIEANINVIVNEKPDLFYLPQMSSEAYINAEEFLFNNGYFNSQVNSRFTAITPAVEIFRKRRAGLISAADSADQMNSLKMIDSRKEYKKYFYHNAVIQQYFVNLKGGSNNNAYLFSIAYDKNNGQLDNPYKKLNVRFENTYRPIKNLEVSIGVYYTNSTSATGGLAYNSIKINGRDVPYLRFADNDGNPLPVPIRYKDSYTDTAGQGKLLNWKYFPLEDYKHNKSTTDIQELFSNVGIRYKINRFLDADFKYQYQLQQSADNRITDIESYETRNLINTFSQLDRTTNVVKYIVPLGGIRSKSTSAVRSYTARGQLNFNYVWGVHGVSAIAGGEVRQSGAEGDLFTVYGYTSDPLVYSNVDLVNSYPTFLNGSFQNIPGTSSFSNTVNRFVSLYSNVSYTFRQRYILSGSFRKDGSNIFGVNTNEKWKPLYSYGAGWELSQEKFYAISWLPLLKIKGTFGYSGNVDLRKSALPIARYSIDPTTNLPLAQIMEPNNPELRWEEVRQINIGIDFASKNSIFSGSVEYYTKTGIDLYAEAPYDYTAWGVSGEVTKNVGSMSGQGVDILLQSKNINRNFKWTTTLLFNYNNSKTTQYYKPSSENIFSLIGSGNTIVPVIGKPLYAIVAYKWGNLNSSGDPQGYLNGALSTDYSAIVNEAGSKGIDGNLIFIGASAPTSFGSLINSFSYRQLSLSINLMYKLGYYFRRPAISYNSLITSGIGHKDYMDRWKVPGDELYTNIPSFTYPNNPNRDAFYEASEINVLKGDHIRLQYINLTYTVAKINRLPFNQFQIYANAANLGIVWKSNKAGLDPDYPASFPPSRSWAIGIRTNF